MEDKKVINIEDFFTEDREKEGVWFEPRVGGKLCGIQFLVTGIASDENIIAAERFDREMNELEEIKDPVEKINKRKVIEANRVTENVIGIRAAGGENVLFGGKPLEYSKPLIQQILLKAPLIRTEIINFAMERTNFIKREKND